MYCSAKCFGDERSYFESFNKSHFTNAGIDAEFIQDNESLSGRGVVRGLHFQLAPTAQGKLVKNKRGRVLDIALDIRKDHLLTENILVLNSIVSIKQCCGYL